jgi:prevent-host-death family protein
MRSVNALEIRNHLGAVLDDLERTGEPVIVSKGRKPRAVLISVEDFQKRFVDRQTEERRKALMDRVLAARAERVGEADSLSVLRALRGPLG